MKRHLLIILRTCTRVNMLNDTGSGRYVKVSKHELVNQCVSSLIHSINHVQGHEVELIVLDDHSSEAAVCDIKNILANCKFPTTFIPVTDGTGSAHTMSKVYEQVEMKASDLWYHVEDDYLHMPEAIHDMIDTVDHFEQVTGDMIAINPHDDMWRYNRQIYPSYILLGPYRHYRTVVHSTYTCLASKKIYDKYRKYFWDVVILAQQKADWIEDKSINNIWQKEDVKLYSPIPGLAFHIMDESGKDKYFDINELWDSTPKLWKSSDKPKIAIATLFNESHKKLAEITCENKKLYADKHGYDLISKTDNFSPTQIHFDKFVHISDILKTNPDIDWVWWLDNDALITNFDIKIEDLIDNDYHIIMSTDVGSLNTGSFIVKNSPQSKEWLEFLISKKTHYKNDTKWFDQQAVIDFYVKFQDLFKIVPQQWINSYNYSLYGVDGIDLLGQDGSWAPGDFVIHWPGLPNDTRIKLANQYITQIKDTR